MALAMMSFRYILLSIKGKTQDFCTYSSCLLVGKLIKFGVDWTTCVCSFSFAEKAISDPSDLNSYSRLLFDEFSATPRKIELRMYQHLSLFFYPKLLDAVRLYH
jgi:hypothetical protein